MPKNPILTVVVNYLNGERFLESALRSIRAQDFSNYQVLIVDNASKVPIIRDQLPGASDEVRIMRLPETTKLYAARNKALEVIKTEYVAFHDVDDVWAPTKLSRQLDYLKANKEMDLVFTGFKAFRGNHLPELFSGSREGSVEILNPKSLARNYSVPMSSMLGRNSLFQQLEGFKTQYEIIGDFDFTMRAARSRAVSKISLPLTAIRLHDDSTSHSNRDLQVREMREWAANSMPSFPDWMTWRRDFEDEITLVQLMSDIGNQGAHLPLKSFLNLKTLRRQAAILRYLGRNVLSRRWAS